jgi:hypothetical protein
MLVCGGRDFEDQEFLNETLDRICFNRGWILEPGEYGNFLAHVHLIHGGARGTDLLAEDWAIGHWCDWTEFEADWDTHGKKAGPIRNQQMLEEGKPDVVVAFPGGKGTADMVRRAKKAGIEVIEMNKN